MNPEIPHHEAQPNYTTLIASLRQNYNERKSQNNQYNWRLHQLNQLRKLILENETTWKEAINSDLGRDFRETYNLEILGVINEIDFAISHLKNWMSPKKQKTHFLSQPASTYIYSDSLGVILIISPWNYPLSLVIMPLIGAISAGNNVLIKPSEIAKETANLFQRFVPQYLDNDAFKVVLTDKQNCELLLKEKFDLIFFTGSINVGKTIMRAASAYLTPVVLELGGKSPCFVHNDAEIEICAKRIIWGKFTNSGQSCVAPDYVLVHPEIEDLLVEKFLEEIKVMYSENPKNSESYSSIVSVEHVQRLCKLLEGDFRVVCGGLTEVDIGKKYFPPTILRNVDLESRVMEEEIFGPILPIITCESPEKAISFINSRPKPLALYVFTQSEEVAGNFLLHTSSGGVCINETMMHVSSPFLKFGGVGDSGMGSYHGKTSFETFSHLKPVLWKTFSAFESLNPRYPPFTDEKYARSRRLIELFSSCDIL